MRDTLIAGRDEGRGWSTRTSKPVVVCFVKFSETIYFEAERDGLAFLFVSVRSVDVFVIDEILLSLFVIVLIARAQGHH